MVQLTATERTTRFATTVDDLPSAWAFVMAHVDAVGDDPSIQVTPFWSYGEDGTASARKFSVAVSGMVEEV